MKGLMWKRGVNLGTLTYQRTAKGYSWSGTNYAFNLSYEAINN